MTLKNNICCRYCSHLFNKAEQIIRFEKLLLAQYDKIDKRYKIDTNNMTEEQRIIQYIDGGVKINNHEKTIISDFRIKIWALKSERCPSCLHPLNYYIQPGLPGIVKWKKDTYTVIKP